MDRKEFVEQTLSEILRMAKPNLVRCEHLEKDEDEFCRVHCENGCSYDINISYDSLAAIVLDVFNKMINK